MIESLLSVARFARCLKLKLFLRDTSTGRAGGFHTPKSCFRVKTGFFMGDVAWECSKARWRCRNIRYNVGKREKQDILWRNLAFQTRCKVWLLTWWTGAAKADNRQIPPDVGNNNYIRGYRFIAKRKCAYQGTIAWNPQDGSAQTSQKSYRSI